MVQIAVNAAFIRPGRVGGAEQAAYSLLRGLAEIVGPNNVRVLCTTSNANGELAVAEKIPGVEYLGIGTDSRSRFVSEILAGRYLSNCSALINLNYFTPPISSNIVVATIIHDAQYRHFPENFSAKKRLWLRAAHRSTIRRADVVVVPSHFVREDLGRLYGASALEKVAVVPNAVEWPSWVLTRSRTGDDEPLGRRCFLTVSADYPHKNYETLRKALSEYRRRGGRLTLKVIGQPVEGLSGVQKRSSPRISEEGIEILGYVSEERLWAEMRESVAMVYPSVFEGFGLPPVESLGVGVPVITTSCGSIPEVTRNLAHYVNDPWDHVELARAMAAVERNPQGFSPEAEEAASIRLRYEPKRVAMSLLDVLGVGL